MGGRASRVKGQVGERSFFKLCNEAVKDLDWPYRHTDGDVFKRHPAPRHGAGQPDNTDPMGVLPITIEVKRVEKPQHTKWLQLLQSQARPTQTPVLAWRRNSEPWTCYAIMDENEFKEWLRWKLTIEPSTTEC
jgi:hypothetical protein